MALDTSYVSFSATGYVPVLSGTASVFYQAAKPSGAGIITFAVGTAKAISFPNLTIIGSGTTHAKTGSSTINDTFKITAPIYTNSLSNLQSSLLPSTVITLGGGIITSITGSFDNETKITTNITDSQFQLGSLPSKVGTAVINPAAAFIPIIRSLQPNSIIYCSGVLTVLTGISDNQTKVSTNLSDSQFQLGSFPGKVGNAIIAPSAPTLPLILQTPLVYGSSVKASITGSFDYESVLTNITDSQFQTSYVSGKVGNSTIPDVFKVTAPIYTNTLTNLQASLLPSQVVTFGTGVTTTTGVGNTTVSSFSVTITNFGTSISVTKIGEASILPAAPYIPFIRSLQPNTILYGSGVVSVRTGICDVETKVYANATDSSFQTSYVAGKVGNAIIAPSAPTLPLILQTPLVYGSSIKSGITGSFDYESVMANITDSSFQTSYVSGKVGSSTINDTFKVTAPIYTNTLTNLQASLLPSSAILFGTSIKPSSVSVGDADNQTKVMSGPYDYYQTSYVSGKVGNATIPDVFKVTAPIYTNTLTNLQASLLPSQVVSFGTGVITTTGVGNTNISSFNINVTNLGTSIGVTKIGEAVVSPSAQTLPLILQTPLVYGSSVKAGITGSFDYEAVMANITDSSFQTSYVSGKVGNSTIPDVFKVTAPIYTNTLTNLQASLLPSPVVLFGTSIKPSSVSVGDADNQTKIITNISVSSFQTSYVSDKVGSSTIPDVFKVTAPIYTNTLTNLQASLLPSQVVALGTGIKTTTGVGNSIVSSYSVTISNLGTSIGVTKIGEAVVAPSAPTLPLILQTPLVYGSSIKAGITGSFDYESVMANITDSQFQTSYVSGKVGSSTINDTFKVTAPIYTNILTNLQASLLPSPVVLFGTSIKPSSVSVGDADNQTKVISGPYDYFQTSSVSGKVGNATIPDVFKVTAPIYTNTLTNLQASLQPSLVITFGTGLTSVISGSFDYEAVLANVTDSSFQTSYVSGKVGSGTIPDVFKVTAPIYTNTLTNLQSSLLPSPVVSLGSGVKPVITSAGFSATTGTPPLYYGSSIAISKVGNAVVSPSLSSLPIINSLQPGTIVGTSVKAYSTGTFDNESKIFANITDSQFQTSYVSSKIGSSTIPDAFKAVAPIYTNTLTNLQASLLPSQVISLGAGVKTYSTGTFDNQSKVSTNITDSSFQTSYVSGKIGSSTIPDAFKAIAPIYTNTLTNLQASLLPTAAVSLGSSIKPVVATAGFSATTGTPPLYFGNSIAISKVGNAVVQPSASSLPTSASLQPGAIYGTSVKPISASSYDVEVKVISGPYDYYQTGVIISSIGTSQMSGGFTSPNLYLQLNTTIVSGISGFSGVGWKTGGTNTLTQFWS